MELRNLGKQSSEVDGQSPAKKKQKPDNARQVQQDPITTPRIEPVSAASEEMQAPSIPIEVAPEILEVDPSQESVEVDTTSIAKPLVSANGRIAVTSVLQRIFSSFASAT